MNTKNAAPQQQKPQTTIGDSASPAKPAAVCAAPSSEEVQRMIGWLRVELGHLVTCQQAADLIERLAARVPDGCVVVPRSLTKKMRLAFHQANEQYESEGGYDSPDHQWSALIAAGEVK